MIYVLAITQVISFLMISYLYKESEERDKQVIAIVTVLHKKFGVTMPELAETLADYVENNINLEEK